VRCGEDRAHQYKGKEEAVTTSSAPMFKKRGKKTFDGGKKNDAKEAGKKLQ
jgi:hypothetical protein